MRETRVESKDSDEPLGDEVCEPRLGYATTKELIDEIYARIETHGQLFYRTVDEPLP